MASDPVTVAFLNSNSKDSFDPAERNGPRRRFYEQGDSLLNSGNIIGRLHGRLWCASTRGKEGRVISLCLSEDGILPQFKGTEREKAEEEA